MNEGFVIKTDDKNFKEALDRFLSKHCSENNKKAVVYELNEKGVKDVMKVVDGY